MNRSEVWTRIYAAAIAHGCGPRRALSLANTGLDEFIGKFRGGSTDQDSAASAVSVDLPAHGEEEDDEFEPATSYDRVLTDLYHERLSIRTVIEGYIASIS